MEVGVELRRRIESWETLSRWERSELGKDLRRLGLSYGEIMDLIQVKKSTVATWCREVRLSDEQYQAIKERTFGSRMGIPVNTNWRRREEIECKRTAARDRVPDLICDPLWVAGTVLCWAEGAKHEITSKWPTPITSLATLRLLDPHLPRSECRVFPSTPSARGQ